MDKKLLTEEVIDIIESWEVSHSSLKRRTVLSGSFTLDRKTTTLAFISYTQYHATLNIFSNYLNCIPKKNNTQFRNFTIQFRNQTFFNFHK